MWLVLQGHSTGGVIPRLNAAVFAELGKEGGGYGVGRDVGFVGRAVAGGQAVGGVGVLTGGWAVASVPGWERSRGSAAARFPAPLPPVKRRAFSGGGLRS